YVHLAAVGLDEQLFRHASAAARLKNECGCGQTGTRYATCHVGRLTLPHAILMGSRLDRVKRSRYAGALQPGWSPRAGPARRPGPTPRAGRKAIQDRGRWALSTAAQEARAPRLGRALTVARGGSQGRTRARRRGAGRREGAAARACPVRRRQVSSGGAPARTRARLGAEPDLLGERTSLLRVARRNHR